MRRNYLIQCLMPMSANLQKHLMVQKGHICTALVNCIKHRCVFDHNFNAEIKVIYAKHTHTLLETLPSLNKRCYGCVLMNKAEELIGENVSVDLRLFAEEEVSKSNFPQQISNS